MHEFLTRHGEPSDDQRRLMPPEVAERIMAAAAEDPIADPSRINALVHRMGDPTRMDGWQATKELTDSLGYAHDLYWGDLGLLRVCLGNEHATAVFDGNEIDYRSVFADNPEILKISRLGDLLQDGGKVLSVAETGANFAQSFYNVLIAQRVVAGIDDKILRPAAKRAVIALTGLDVIGGMLQGHDIAEKLAQFNADWPEEFIDYRDDLMLASYLSDASAHSAYRLYRNARSGFPEPAVRPDDVQLTFLFEHHRSGAVTLTPDRCALLLSRLPGINRLQYLLTGELGPHSRDDEVFAEVVNRKARADGGDSLQIHDSHEYGEDVYIMEGLGRLGISTNVMSYFSDRSDAAIDRRYWLPGDGRVWERSVWVGNSVPSEPGPPPETYTHPNPEIAEMQKRVLTADRVYDSDIGQPLPPQEAWKIIHTIENLT